MPPLAPENKVVDATQPQVETLGGQEPVQLVPKYNDFKTVPVNQELDPLSLPVESKGFSSMLQTAEAQAPKGAAYFTFTLEGGTYKYNFKTKKIIRVK
jgi:hypothetical protein